METRLTETE